MTNRRRAAPWLLRLAVDREGTVHEVILEELRSAILAGVARPGTIIPVDAIAERFAASRIPVREALKTLVGEGLVDHLPRAGYTVAQLTAGELAELYLVREALEGAALAVAVGNATPADDSEVSAAHAALSAAIALGDLRGHHRDSRRFHFALAAPSRMHRLLGMFESAWNLTEPLQPMSYVSSEMTQTLHADHDVMREAFLARDVPALLAASTTHYRRLQDALAAVPRNAGLFG